MDFSEEMQELVRKNGDEVNIHTTECVLWKTEHENCFGCPSEIGCSKAVCLLGIAMRPMMYNPTDYEDYERMSNKVVKDMDFILKANTRDEIRSVIW